MWRGLTQEMGALALLATAVCTVTAEAGNEGGLTRVEAVARVLAANPRLEAEELGARASEALVEQAGRPPNPELELEVESFAGTGPLAGFDGAERTFAVHQELLLGGKLGTRREVAAGTASLSRYDVETYRQSLTVQAEAAFDRLVLAQERVELADDLQRLSTRLVETVALRVGAGKVAPVDLTRAQSEEAKARVFAIRAQADLKTARRVLAGLWGARQPDFDHAAGAAPVPAAPPPLPQLREHLRTSPRYQRLEAEIEQRERLAEMERASVIPDLTVSVGTTRDRDSGQSTWVAGISIPIPLLDRNSGARRAAELGVTQARRRAEADRVDLEVALEAAAQRLEAAVRTADEIRDAIVPAAEEAFEVTRIGYREGKLGVLDALDAEREVFDARMAWLDVLEESIAARLELEVLIGRSLGELRPTTLGASVGASEHSERGEDP